MYSNTKQVLCCSQIFVTTSQRRHFRDFQQNCSRVRCEVVMMNVIITQLFTTPIVQPLAALQGKPDLCQYCGVNYLYTMDEQNGKCHRPASLRFFLFPCAVVGEGHAWKPWYTYNHPPKVHLCPKIRWRRELPCLGTKNDIDRKIY